MSGNLTLYEGETSLCRTNNIQRRNVYRVLLVSEIENVLDLWSHTTDKETKVEFTQFKVNSSSTEVKGFNVFRAGLRNNYN